MADASNASALLFVQAVASFSRSELRWELATIAAAVALLSIALAAIALFCFRRGTRDLTLLYFGLFCILYAVRLLALLSSFRSLFNESQMFWNYVNWVITCTIILPFGLFFYQIADEHLRNFLRWLLAAQTVFAIFGILALRSESVWLRSPSRITSWCSPRSRPPRYSWSSVNGARGRISA